MAVTKIWPVRGRLDHSIDYAINPEKTDSEIRKPDLDGLEDVMNYAVNEEKTEKKFYVSGVNCNPAIARQQFQTVKTQFGKEGGIIAYHGYQSFTEGEVTPQEAHEIGVELAKTIWGEGFQVVVATHLNTKCLHNHFVVNSVSYLDGKRCRQKQWTDISKINDEICSKYQLDVVERHGRGIPYQLAKAEREGAPTRLNIAREAIEDALSVSCNLRELKYHLSTMGYICQFDENRKYWTIRQQEWKRPIRLIRMGEEYSNDQIRQRLRNNPPEVRRGMLHLDERKHYRRSYSSGLRKTSRHRKISGLRGLYYHYCYLLGYLPKQRLKPYQVSPALRDDLIKLNEISREVRLLQEHQIDDLQQLFDYRKAMYEKAFLMEAQIRRLRNQKSKNSTTAMQKTELQSEIEKLKEQLKDSRRQVVICDRISSRGQKMKEKLQSIQEDEKNMKREEMIK